MQNPVGYHLVGSVPFTSAQEVFEKLPAALPGRLNRLPDGETGTRLPFTIWQWFLLQDQAPRLAATFDAHMHPQPAPDLPADEVTAALAAVAEAGFTTHYDDVSLSSYAIFKEMKEKGVIPREVRFQVSVPTPANVIAPLVQPQFQRGFEPIYERALLKALRRIQDEIPHEELAIQLDLAVDTAFWEGVYFKWWGEGDAQEAQLAYLKRMIDQIDADVELGLHNCYGDIGHKHFFEPITLSAPADRFLRLTSLITHPIAFFHVPVPPSVPLTSLPSFYAPLIRLLPLFTGQHTELYLGVVQANDAEGTRARIEAAEKLLGGFSFGVATECGWGRTPTEEVESILALSKACCGPWSAE